MQLVEVHSNRNVQPVVFSNNSRIAIVGVSGSGKSTLAEKLAKKYCIDHIELDSLFMNQNWVETELIEFRNRVSNRLDNLSSYIIDGNYKKIHDITWDKCDSIIWLNYSKALIMKRVILRTIKRVITHQKLWNGNKETFRKSFMSKDSILLWSWNTYERRKTEYQELKMHYENRNIIFIVVNKPKEINKVFGIN